MHRQTGVDISHGDTCGAAVLFPPGIGGGVSAAGALFPCPHDMLTWPADQRGGRDGVLELGGSGEAVAHPACARIHCLLYATGQLAWSLLDGGGVVSTDRRPSVGQ